MTLDDVITYFGNKKRAAEAIGLKRQSVTLWLDKGYVPLLQQYRFEKITKGKLKAYDELLTKIR